MSCLKLQFDRPAMIWEEAFPIGNGSMGAMVYGGVDFEQIQINNDTLWSGMPDTTVYQNQQSDIELIRKAVFAGKYQKAQESSRDFLTYKRCHDYMPLGDIYIKPIHEIGRTIQYSRELSLENAEINISYTREKGISYHRQIYCSKPNDVMVIHLTSSKNKAISFSIMCNSELNHETKITGSTIGVEGAAPSDAEPNEMDNQLVYHTNDNTIRFHMMVQLVNLGGTVKADADKLSVYGANEVFLLVATETNFVAYNKEPDGNKNLLQCNNLKIKRALNDGMPTVYEKQLQYYQNLYKRVEFSLDSTCNPTMSEMIGDKEKYIKELTELSFQYARYLMISASSEQSQPMNLQGIWNRQIQPPWASNYTTNINTEMNYWAAEISNLSECHMPLIDMIKELSVAGEETAKIYGCRGFVVHHNTDLWRKTTPAGGNDPRWALWPMASAWLCRHLWEHYLFQQDRVFLQETAFPITQKCVEFYIDWLIADSEGFYVTCPSTSPENVFQIDGTQCAVTKASTMDMAILKDLFENYLCMAELLKYSSNLVNQVKEYRSKLYPYKIGQDGRLLEWDVEFEEHEKGHRHQSHLYGVYPGHSIQKENTALFNAAKKSLETRLAYGGGQTGWSCGWIINLFARFEDGENAGKYVRTLLTKSMYDNLLDAHPPFQIDGNFGLLSGICEMLVQSDFISEHEYRIKILPAIPTDWKKGRVSGIKAKGGFLVEIDWDLNKEINVTIQSLYGNKCTVISNRAINNIHHIE
jgi:hypothetical protein